MKTFLTAIFIVCVGITATQAGNFWQLHVSSNAGNGGSAPSSCDGTIDLSTGCAMPMLGVM